ncbi:BGTF surface domain-containing protein [Halorussus sp. AFM4]|uniref:BGTF surface domain-containing protein n=1 Tax=Halorussus sp. AFM4 TaxID=3421651 RepID=UPI003EB8B2A6
MFESTLHRRVALAALVVLAGVTGVAASATPSDATVADAKATPQESTASLADPDAANVTVSTNASDGDVVLARPVANQTFRVRTDAAPNSSLDVEFETDERIYTAAAAVGEDGNATVTLDLSDLDPGTEFEMYVTGEDLDGAAAVEGRIVNESVMASIAASGTTATTTATTAADQSSDIPGFGALAALAGLVGAAALARRA